MKLLSWCLLRRSLCSYSTVEMAASVFLFPGQGSQYVGMTQKLSGPAAAESRVFTAARRALDYDLLSLCVSGPKSRLDETEICQPAVMAASLAAAETLTGSKPVSGRGCTPRGGSNFPRNARAHLLLRRCPSVVWRLQGSVWEK